jgi:superoxide dismutase
MNHNTNTNRQYGSGNKKPLQNGNTRTPHCKVCFDAKKPRDVYESHWVKDREGNVTCVTLLEQECRFCFQTGHTVKFCPEIAKVNAERERANAMEERRNNRIKKEAVELAKKTQEKPSRRGGFALLSVDSDDEEEKKPVKEEWPTLSTSIKSKPVKKGVSFADALQKTKLEYESEVVAKANSTQGAGFTVLSRGNNGTLNIKESTNKAPVKEVTQNSVQAITIPKILKNRKDRSWADDWSDSDDDEVSEPIVQVEPAKICCTDSWD